LPALFTLRRAGGLATAAAIALTLSACSSSTSSSSSASAQATAAAASGGVYNIGLITPTAGIDPLTTTQYDTMFAVGLASAQLVNETPAGQLKAQLASSWTQAANKLSWTFTLRPGLKFSNGQPLTATDVVSTFDAILSPTSQSIVKTVDSGQAAVGNDFAVFPDYSVQPQGLTSRSQNLSEVK